MRHVTSQYVFCAKSSIVCDTKRSALRLLFDYGKEKVVLYVGHENSAQKVYHRVGFAGLCGEEKVEGVEDSLELGFVGTTRGHW